MTAWDQEKEMMIAAAGKTGTEIRIADVETEETEITTVIAMTEETMTAEWIPDPLFLFRDREHAVVKDHRKMTDVI